MVFNDESNSNSIQGSMYKWCSFFSGYIWPTYTKSSNFGGSCWTPLPTLKSDIINAFGLGFNVFLKSHLNYYLERPLWKHEKQFSKHFLHWKFEPSFLRWKRIWSCINIRFEIDERKIFSNTIIAISLHKLVKIYRSVSSTVKYNNICFITHFWHIALLTK